MCFLRRLSTLCLLISPLLVGTLAAQTAQPDTKGKKDEKPEKPARQIRFLPVGDLPPFEQEIRNGIAYELPPPEGSVPPRSLVLGAEDKDKKKGGSADPANPDQKPAEPALRLNQLTEGFKIPEGAGPLALRAKGDDGKAEPWLMLQRPEQGNMLVILWRAGGNKGTWAKPSFMILPDSVEEAPAGKVRFVNVSPVTVGVAFGEEKIALLAGKTYQRPVEVGKDLPFQLGAMDAANKFTRFQRDVITQNPNERTLVLIYRADGEQPRRDLKSNVIREPVPGTPPVP